MPSIANGFCCEIEFDFPGILCKILVVVIKLFEHDIIRLPIEWAASCCGILIVAMVSLLFVIGFQPKRNSMFELKLSVNPLFPAVNIFACVYLLAELTMVTWIRYIIWMLIGEYTLYDIYDAMRRTPHNAPH